MQRPGGFGAFRELQYAKASWEQRCVEVRAGRAKCEMLQHSTVCSTWVPILTLRWWASLHPIAEAQWPHL